MYRPDPHETPIIAERSSFDMSARAVTVEDMLSRHPIGTSARSENVENIILRYRAKPSEVCDENRSLGTTSDTPTRY